ncbi:hypothetical protein GVAV_000259 [Gurleya vavrai]
MRFLILITIFLTFFSVLFSQAYPKTTLYKLNGNDSIEEVQEEEIVGQNVKICDLSLNSTENKKFKENVKNHFNLLVEHVEKDGSFNKLTSEQKKYFKICYNEYAYLKETSKNLKERCPWFYHESAEDYILDELKYCNDFYNQFFSTDVSLPIDK